MNQAKKLCEALMGRVFKIPAIIALLTLAGLLSALIGDNAFDWVSWLLLITPIGVICWKLA